MRLEPLASEPAADVVARIAPTLQGYIDTGEPAVDGEPTVRA
jgi:hypothetical protein